MNILREVAKQVLGEQKTPLHYKEITRLALEQGILETDDRRPDASMNAQIVLDIKHKGLASDFIKVAKGTYALNPNKIVLPPNKSFRKRGA